MLAAKSECGCLGKRGEEIRDVRISLHSLCSLGPHHLLRRQSGSLCRQTANRRLVVRQLSREDIEKQLNFKRQVQLLSGQANRIKQVRRLLADYPTPFYRHCTAWPCIDLSSRIVQWHICQLCN